MILEKISPSESQSIRILAKKILTSYQELREIFRRYSENIELVDPQLRNNKDLQQALLNYESSWSKGKTYLIKDSKIQQIIFFNNVLEGLSEKYESFKEKLEWYDTEVFIKIPMILLLRRISNEDKSLCENFLPEILEPKNSAYSQYQEILKIIQNINLSMG